MVPLPDVLTFLLTQPQFYYQLKAFLCVEFPTALSLFPTIDGKIPILVKSSSPSTLHLHLQLDVAGIKHKTALSDLILNLQSLTSRCWVIIPYLWVHLPFHFPRWSFHIFSLLQLLELLNTFSHWTDELLFAWEEWSNQKRTLTNFHSQGWAYLTPNSPPVL